MHSISIHRDMNPLDRLISQSVGRMRPEKVIEDDDYIKWGRMSQPYYEESRL